MSLPIESSPRGIVSDWLRNELMLDVARRQTMARIVIGTPLMVAIAMTFQIPLPAYSAYLVFLVCQEDAASTLMTAIGGIAAITLAVALSLLLYVFNAAEPALRIPLLALCTFLGTFLARTSVLGPVAFLAGYILVLTQTLIDEFPATEPLVHSVLWLWVVVGAPVVVSVLMTLLSGGSPVTLARHRAQRVLEALADHVEVPTAADATRIRQELIALDQLKNKALGWRKDLNIFAQEDAALVALLLEIVEIARVLPAATPAAMRRDAAEAIRHASRNLVARRQHQPPSPYVMATPPDGWHEPSGMALHQAIADLVEQSMGQLPHAAAVATTPPRPFLRADAFQNRAHARFAIKVTLAVLASYATYTLLDWPGIRTAVTTCFFVSLTTFGESMHKFTLRASGAIVGGLLAGLCLVFVLPLMSDIGQLCLLVAAVSLLASWFSTGSEAISYAGMQVAFAFFLGVLQGYGPAGDLTELRDRVVGILVGNAWVTLIFATVWPVSGAQEIGRFRALLLEKLAALLERPASEVSLAAKADIARTLGQMTVLHAREGFEWRRIDGAMPSQPTLEASEAIASRALVVLRLRGEIIAPPGERNTDEAIARQLRALAAGDELTPRVTHDPSASRTLASARHHLEEEVEHAQGSR